MSAPKFIKVGNAYTDIEFENGRIFPATDTLEPRQTARESGAGYVQVVTRGPRQRWLEADFGYLSSAQMVNVTGFIEDPTVDFKAKTFTFRDENGVDHTVRYWSDNMPRQTTRNFKKNILMLLRIE